MKDHEVDNIISCLQTARKWASTIEGNGSGQKEMVTNSENGTGSSYPREANGMK